MKRRHALRSVSAALVACGALSLTSLAAFAADTIKVGILHSLSGTMAISETVLKDVALMAIEEINAKGGVLGKKLEPSVVDPLSKNVFYTGAAPNQQASPAVEYLMSKDGGGAKRFVLLGTDYMYPRTTNKILRAFLKSKGRCLIAMRAFSSQPQVS